MTLHHIGENIHVSRIIRECLDRLNGREGLESELRQETEIELPILCKRLVAVPYIPVMHVTALRILRLIHTSA